MQDITLILCFNNLLILFNVELDPMLSLVIIHKTQCKTAIEIFIELFNFYLVTCKWGRTIEAFNQYCNQTSHKCCRTKFPKAAWFECSISQCLVKKKAFKSTLCFFCLSAGSQKRRNELLKNSNPDERLVIRAASAASLHNPNMPCLDN